MSRIALLIIAGLFVFTACKKGPGEGGHATLRGKVYVKNYNGSFTVLKGEYYAGDERVYIIYGDNNSAYDDFYRTSFDGTFEFRHLRAGTYKVFTYSKKRQQDAVGDSTVITQVTIKSDAETVVVPDLVIFK